MFYANPVIRKQDVGLRGAWVAMGIEINFPLAHSLTTVSPVTYGITRNPDGSGGVWVADIDRQTGLEWRVEFVLKTGSALLQENVSLYNRGSVRQPFLFWSNAGTKIEDQNSGFRYPTYVVGTHGFDILDTWPVDTTGVDRSTIKNNTTPEAFFAFGSREPFFAAYHPATRTGTAHYADPSGLAGEEALGLGAGRRLGPRQSHGEFPVIY